MHAGREGTGGDSGIWANLQADEVEVGAEEGGGVGVNYEFPGRGSGMFWEADKAARY